MLKSKGYLSLRIKITLIVLAVLFLALVLINVIIISTVGNRLIEQKAKSQTEDVIFVANDINQLVGLEKWDMVEQYCADFGEKYNCRVLVFNNASAVAIDNYHKLDGTKFSNKEVDACLNKGMKSAWGTYFIEYSDENSFSSDYVSNDTGYWAIYVTARIEYNNELIGAVLISSPFQDLVDEVDYLSWFIVLISLAVGIIISIVLVLLLKRYFHPLRSMSRAISLMSKGDFSVRANAGQGHDELNELATAFNTMCSKMEILDESRNKFVSDASHEMKTPLATMKILVDSLINQSSEIDKDIYDEFLNDINHEIDRLTYLINDLLTLVRMDKTENKLEFVPIQITDLLDKVRHKLQPLAAMKGITINYKPDGDPTVYGNAMKLEQAFTNLVDNAIKYSTEDTNIFISLSQDAQNAIIGIADQGIGISQENLERIFERFYRVDKARSRETGGTGLGLSIVDSIIKQHNGEISVDSEQGRGTTFTVILPL